MSVLFSRLPLRDLELQNRIFVAPMCQFAGSVENRMRVPLDVVVRAAYCVAVGLALLFDSKWSFCAAQALGIHLPYPPQYRLSHPDTWQGAASFNA